MWRGSCRFNSTGKGSTESSHSASCQVTQGGERKQPVKALKGHSSSLLVSSAQGLTQGDTGWRVWSGLLRWGTRTVPASHLEGVPQSW